jgi:hypothetical protein
LPAGFQTGVSFVATPYSIGSPIFAIPGPLSFNYHFTSPAFVLGAPSFAQPTVSVFISIRTIHANAYSLGSPAFATPGFIQKRVFAAKPLTIGSPVFSRPAFTIKYRLFTNSWAVDSPAFASATLQHNFQIARPVTYALGPLAWSAVGPFVITLVFHADPYWLDLRFAAPRLETEVVDLGLPPTYRSQIEDAAELLVGTLNRLLSSVPPTPPTPTRDNLRILVSVLRNNATEAIRGTTLGTQLQQIYQTADQAGATFPGVEMTRQFLMSHAGSLSLMTQLVMRAALVMTLGLECNIIGRLKFKTHDDVQQLILQVRDAFESAKAIGIDELDVLVYQTVNAMGGAIINLLARNQLKLPRFVSWHSKSPMPSLYLANRIYGDASRADEISDENDVIHPAFMPINLRVLSYPPIGRF